MQTARLLALVLALGALTGCAAGKETYLLEELGFREHEEWIQAEYLPNPTTWERRGGTSTDEAIAPAGSKGKIPHFHEVAASKRRLSPEKVRIRFRVQTTDYNKSIQLRYAVGEVRAGVAPADGLADEPLHAATLPSKSTGHGTFVQSLELPVREPQEKTFPKEFTFSFLIVTEEGLRRRFFHVEFEH